MSRPLPHIPEQFTKLAALAERSTFPAERDTARLKAEALLSPEVGGYDRALRIAAYQAVIAKAGPPDLFAGFDEWQEIDDPGHLAREAEKRAGKRRTQEARRAELVAEFGSLGAVLEPCEREQALLAAVAPWRVACDSPHQRWTRSLAGLSAYEDRQAPSDLVAAIEAAFQIPKTYAEARAEMAYWDRRNDDMELAATADGGYVGDEMLDMPCLWRCWRVRSLAEHRMELRTVAEIAARMRAYRFNETGTDPEVEDALLRDLDALAAWEARAAGGATVIPPNHPCGAGQIGDALTANPSRSDRDIARALGCSPTTVGRMRGQMGLAGVRRSVRRGGQIYAMRGRAPPAEKPIP